MKLLKLLHHTCGLPSLARPDPLDITSIGRRVVPPSLGSWRIKSKSQNGCFLVSPKELSVFLIIMVL
jgi:hypothetical protein